MKEQWRIDLVDQIKNSFNKEELDKQCRENRKKILSAIAKGNKEEVKHLKLFPEFLIGYIVYPVDENRIQKHRIEYWPNYGIVAPSLITTNGNVSFLVDMLPKGATYESA